MSSIKRNGVSAEHLLRRICVTDRRCGDHPRFIHVESPRFTLPGTFLIDLPNSRSGQSAERAELPSVAGLRMVPIQLHLRRGLDRRAVTPTEIRELEPALQVVHAAALATCRAPRAVIPAILPTFTAPTAGIPNPACHTRQC